MKALYISYDGATDPLGQSQVIPYLKTLSKTGICFTLVTYDKVTKHRQMDLGSLKDELLKSDIKWVSIKYHKHPKVLVKIYDIMIGLITCSYLVIVKKIEVVHGRSFIGAFIGVFLKRIFGVSFLLDYRGLWADERVDGNLWRRGGLLYRVSKYLEKILILSADEITVLTKMAKETIERFPYLKKKDLNIQVIPTCVDLEHFNYKPPNSSEEHKNEMNLVYLGSLGTWYMLEEMADFFIELRKIFSNAHFLFITPAKKATIRQLMEKKGIPDSNYSIKNMSYRQVPSGLSAADLSIFFIKPLFSKISSCPTKLGESLACGLPVIINYGIGDCDKIVKENKIGVVIDEFSRNAYKESILELRALLNKREELSLRCRKVAEDVFSLNRGSRLYRQLYSRMEKGLL